jgi:hypothetical protein
MIISNQAKNCLKNFTEWGGAAGLVSYLIDGEIVNALLITLVFGVLVICFEKYSNRLP